MYENIAIPNKYVVVSFYCIPNNNTADIINSQNKKSSARNWGEKYYSIKKREIYEVVVT